MTRTRQQQTGDDAEARAAAHLAAVGLVIVGRNVHIGRGELDLVARDGDVVVFVEVRRRPSADDGLASVSARKQAILARAAAAWLSAHAPQARARFDVVVVTPTRLVHVPDAFSV